MKTLSESTVHWHRIPTKTTSKERDMLSLIVFCHPWVQFLCAGAYIIEQRIKGTIGVVGRYIHVSNLNKE